MGQVITASEICVFSQMVYGGSRKRTPTKKTFVSLKMDVSFVLNPFLLGVFLWERRIAWCFQFDINNCNDYIFVILNNSLIDAFLNVKLLFCSKQMTPASCFP